MKRSGESGDGKAGTPAGQSTKKAADIREVARRAGVSISTVSRYLNRKVVSPAAERRIEELELLDRLRVARIENDFKRIEELERAIRNELHEKCTCHEAYTGRGLVDPQCRYCDQAELRAVLEKGKQKEEG